MSVQDLPFRHAVPSVSAAQMAEVDRIASAELGIPLEVLMENASHQIAVATRALLGGVRGKRIVAVAGAGNNGGDALGALRHLHGWGAQVEAFVAAPRERLRPLAALQHDILARLGIAPDDTTAIDDRDLIARMRAADAVLDGLLGYSAKGAPRGEIARLIMLANAGARPGQLVAVDIPSGLEPDTGVTLSTVPAGAIRAALTVTLALPKAGLVRETAREFVGELLLADIGIPSRAFEGVGIDTRGLFVQGDLTRLAPPAARG